jgi:hypothetical protein
MVRALPGDLAMRIAASRYGYDLVGNAAAQAVRAELALDGPMWSALVRWWADIASLGLGTSLVSGEPVWHEIAHQLGKRYVQDQPLDWGCAVERDPVDLEGWCAPGTTLQTGRARNPSPDVGDAPASPTGPTPTP